MCISAFAWDPSVADVVRGARADTTRPGDGAGRPADLVGRVGSNSI